MYEYLNRVYVATETPKKQTLESWKEVLLKYKVLERGKMNKWKLANTDQIRREDRYKRVTRIGYDTKTIW